MPADTKLYIKISCSICNGMSRGCPYCDEQGKHYIEATVKRVAEWLREQDEGDRATFKKALEDI